jgi:hypothetical protein
VGVFAAKALTSNRFRHSFSLANLLKTYLREKKFLETTFPMSPRSLRLTLIIKLSAVAILTKL